MPARFAIIRTNTPETAAEANRIINANVAPSTEAYRNFQVAYNRYLDSINPARHEPVEAATSKNRAPAENPTKPILATATAVAPQKAQKQSKPKKPSAAPAEKLRPYPKKPPKHWICLTILMKTSYLSRLKPLTPSDMVRNPCAL